MKRLRKILSLYMLVFSVNASDYMVADDETEMFLTEIVNNIKNAMGYKEEIRVYISSDQTINASAIQSGDIIVNAGAIIQSTTYKELIAILAHEVGHIEGRHIQLYVSHMKDFKKAGLVPTLIGIALTLISGAPEPLMAGIMGGQAMSQGMALGKLRQKEEIADTKAAEALKKLGWHIFDGCLEVHKKLEAQSFMYNEYLSTHPHSSKRIAKYKQYYEQFKNKPMSEKAQALMKRYETKFEIIKKKLNALVIQNEFLRNMFKKGGDANEKYARAVALYRLNRYSEAIKLIDELPKSDVEQAAYYIEIKCMSLINLKRYEEASEVAMQLLQKTLRIQSHRDLVVIFAEAVSAGKLRTKAENAIKYLTIILNARGDDVSVLHELGKLYTMTNQHYKASYCIAQSAFLSDELGLAKVHARRALSSNDPVIKRKSQDLLNAIADAEKEKQKEKSKWWSGD